MDEKTRLEIIKWLTTWQETYNNITKEEALNRILKGKELILRSQLEKENL